MEGRGFDRLRVEELRPDRVQNRVAHLMAAHVRALAGEEGAPADGGVEEVEARWFAEVAAGIEGIKVDSVVQDDGERGADLPLRTLGNELAPKVGRASQRSG